MTREFLCHQQKSDATILVSPDVKCQTLPGWHNNFLCHLLRHPSHLLQHPSYLVKVKHPWHWAKHRWHKELLCHPGKRLTLDVRWHEDGCVTFLLVTQEFSCHLCELVGIIHSMLDKLTCTNWVACLHVSQILASFPVIIIRSFGLFIGVALCLHISTLVHCECKPVRSPRCQPVEWCVPYRSVSLEDQRCWSYVQMYLCRHLNHKR